MAMAAFAVPAMAQSAMAGSGGVDILGQGIFETGGSAFKFPGATDTNYDSIEVGNDRAQALVSSVGAFPWVNHVGATARNNLEIKKNQDTGSCACCPGDSGNMCMDCCLKYNVETIKVGDRTAQALAAGVGVGPSLTNSGALAENNVKIVTNQQ
jgi:hypothetical protein